MHQTWVWGEWIMFSPEIIHKYYQLIWDNITPIPGAFSWNEVVEILLGRENVWPLQTVEWHQIELTRSIGILWLFMCFNIEPTTHRTTFTDPTAGFLYHLVGGLKIDLATLIYHQILMLGMWGDRHSALIFPSLISGICKAVGVPIPSGEVPEKPSAPIRRLTLEVQDRARARHQEKLAENARRQQAAAAGQEGVDVEMPQAPLPPFEGDAQLLRQMFATLTTTGRDVDGIRQDLGTLRTDMQEMRHAVQTTQTFASTARSSTSAIYTTIDRVSDRLSLYTSRVDSIQLQTGEMWDRLGTLEMDMRGQSTLLQEQSSLIRGQSTLLQEQSEMMRQLLARLPPTQDDTTAGPSSFPPSSPPPPF